MARISRRPWMAPSSPGRPCNRLRAASGFAAASAAATLRSTSMRVTRRPWRSSASAQDLPERSETSRSADHPPISTATCLVMIYPLPQGSIRGALADSPRDPDALDLPFQLHAGIFLHARPHGLAQCLDIGRARVAAVDQEIAVHLRHLGVAHHKAAAAGGVDQLPGFVARRILEGRAAGAALDRLRGLARPGDLVHLGGDLLAIAGPALKQRLG